ncbi:hypothetical protein HNQ91_002511 [Filimonas zeae]|uniref:Uncharacterized protein n=1 Tax=Filimonas zeae TaxID=1737353 RepID=A0A917MVQ7_9BACT|nr:hypothetical protein [Filimonas zeae]MDR6339460.1 hypothetical protein [Filimonas zeae]GGH63497.1 hypothetical protein GCM10011379_14470 [Filimonas zeae]
MTNNNLASIAQRLQQPTPPFFKKLRTIGLLMAATGGAVMAAQVELPAVVTQIASYLTVAGGIITSVSQMTVNTPELNTKN